MNTEEITIKFPPDDDAFFAELRKEVQEYFKSTNQNRYGNTRMYAKACGLAVIYLAGYVLPLVFELSAISVVLIYGFLGVWGVFLGVNVGHDAAHHALFQTRKYNDWAMHIFDLLGLSSFNWKNRHVSGHHVFSNIMNYDPDIQQSAVVKIFPQDRRRSFHKWQWLYMPFVYAIFIPRWVFYRDFKDVFYEKIGGFKNRPYPGYEVVKMVLFKLFYLGYLVFLPVALTDHGLMTFFLAFAVLMVAGSATIVVVLLTTHMLDDSFFPDPDEEGMMPYSWAKHQMMTTSDYATENMLVSHLFGGFNHHVIHHLFQHVCHIHYPHLTRILIDVAARHDVVYRTKKRILPAMYSHFKLLYNNGIEPELLSHDF
jgi:linoleoyl-CoA desaturase